MHEVERMNIYYRNNKGTLVSTELKEEFNKMKEFLEVEE